jgi:hypothetical protein
MIGPRGERIPVFTHSDDWKKLLCAGLATPVEPEGMLYTTENVRLEEDEGRKEGRREKSESSSNRLRLY